MRALVIGAGAVGESTALHLRAAGVDVVATMRRNHHEAQVRLKAAGVETARFDLEGDVLAPLLAGVDAVVLTPALTLCVRLAPALRNVARVIAFSSNNVALDPGAPTYVKLAAAEAELRTQAPHAVILRPTLIYGDPRLPTLPSIMRWARRWPILPVPGSGRALQQPVFYDDLGKAAATLARSGAHEGATFALGGPDIVSIKALFQAAACAVMASPAIVPAPRWMLSVGAALLGSRFPLDAAQIARAEKDRVVFPQTPLPADLTPRTSLQDGLSALAHTLGRCDTV